MKNNKGNISVGLVLTIIILIILAGVSVAMLTSDDGILVPKDQNEKDKIINQTEEIKEQINGENQEEK